MIKINNDKLTRFGFSFNRGGAHTARTMMLDELREVISYLDDPNALKTDYSKAIDDENCLGGCPYHCRQRILNNEANQ